VKRETFLVRHGQASARARNYDVLSPLGVQQARRLGEHFVRGGVAFDAVFSGPRQRQRDTARHVVEAMRAAGGGAVPDQVVLDGCDEIPLGAILVLWLPRLLDTDPVARAIAEQRFEHSDDEIRDLLGRAMQAWAAGEVAAPSLLTFAAFVARIEAALDHIRGHGAATLLVTSAGPVAAALHLAAHDGLTTPIDVMRHVVAVPNASVTRVVHDGERLAVASAHDVSHLPPHERSLM
jgi:broad specificity phosphatase PhoE